MYDIFIVRSRYDMRKALPRDTHFQSIIPLEPLEVMPSEMD